MIPFNDLPDIKPYPVLLLQDKQRINHLIKAVHAKLCGVQTLYSQFLTQGSKIGFGNLVQVIR